jgi:hypothetical protein
MGSRARRRNNDEIDVVGELAHALARLVERQHLVGVAWITSSGTSIFGKSSRKSVSHVPMHSTALLVAGSQGGQASF